MLYIALAEGSCHHYKNIKMQKRKLFKLEMEMTISIIFSFCLFLIFLALYFYLLFNLQGRRNLGMIHLIFLEVTTCVKTLRIWAVKTCFELTSMCVSPLYILKYLLTVYFCSARSIYDYGWLFFFLSSTCSSQKEFLTQIKLFFPLSLPYFVFRVVS